MKQEKLEKRIALYEKHIADMEAKNQTHFSKYLKFKAELERYKLQLKDETQGE